MIRVAFLRHAPTVWNAEGRIQGQSDPALSAEGRAHVAERRLPVQFSRFIWTTSPLLRARQTAHFLGIENPVIDPRLTEMNWGEYEGRTLSDLRGAYGKSFADNESHGLDFRPPGGESPRDVQRRLMTWLADLLPRNQDVAAITHKGVMRAAMALATGWDMLGKAPVRMDWRCIQLFTLGTDGQFQVSCANIALESVGRQFVHG